MKFTATVISLALLLAGSVEAHAHIQARSHYRRGPSATYSPPAATSTAVSTPAPTSPAPSNGNGANKRGLAFNDDGLTKNFNSQKIVWAYNWAPTHQGSLPDGVIYFPMLWSADGSKTATWNDDATAAIAAGATHLLGFNEPDLGAQANMSPEDAAKAWMTYMQPFAGKAKLVAPAITNGAPPAMGTGWLDRFIAACTECQIDAWAIHIYDSASNVGYFKNYISDFVAKYGKETLVTEFGASGSTQDQQNFLAEMLPFLDGLDGVTHYAYFGVLPGSLVNSDGSRTPIGDSYVSI
ncbi:hypothetical protein K474DRAFT_1626896 [Panus rudis PR-1116 ss-1]|nr:hypothetical protein K474DRAFT_1626896 [Panus rudis PR-1116 ss-1]